MMFLLGTTIACLNGAAWGLKSLIGERPAPVDVHWWIYVIAGIFAVIVTLLLIVVVFRLLKFTLELIELKREMGR